MARTPIAMPEAPFSLLPEAVQDALACPQCGGTSVLSSTGALCRDCQTAFANRSNGNIDLRLRRPKTYESSIRSVANWCRPGFEFGTIQPRPNPAVDFSKLETPWHLTPALPTSSPKPRSARSIAPGLGRGTGLHREVSAQADFSCGQAWTMCIRWYRSSGMGTRYRFARPCSRRTAWGPRCSDPDAGESPVRAGASNDACLAGCTSR